MRLHPAPSSPADHVAPSEALSKDPPKATSNRVSIDIYRSSTDRSKYLSVPSGSDLAQMLFPADTDGDYQSVSLYKQDVVLESGKPAIGLDVEDILGQIARSGFAFHPLKFSASMSMNVGTR